MQQTWFVSLLGILGLLLSRSGPVLGLPFLGHRLGAMDHMLRFGMDPGLMDPRVMEMLQENAFEKPEFLQIKLLCDQYIKGSGKLGLGDDDLEYQVITQCENYHQGAPGYAPHLNILQQRVTRNPIAAKVLNQKH